MKVKVGEIRDNSDITETGCLTVQETDFDAPVIVRYTSPYSAGQSGGFIAIPEVGTKVLIIQPDNDNNWFYLTSIHGPTQGHALSNLALVDKDIKSPLSDDKLYRARGVPMRLSLKTPLGHNLTLSDEYNKDFFNSKVMLESATGKKVELNDSPEIDSVILRNELGDRIKISSKANGASAPRSIEIECKGPISIITRESELNLHVVDGKELNIINESTGSKRAGPNDPTPGNINIKTTHGDINIDAMDDTGLILVNTEGDNSVINIKSKGTIAIDGEKGVSINSGSGNVVVTGQQIELN